MKALDKTVLLFELLLGTDMARVNEKIDQIHFSDFYGRVVRVVPTLARTQLLADVVERYHHIDLYGILSIQRALEVEQELVELDRRIRLLPTINPYLADGGERPYEVKTVGQVGVEISAQGMRFDDFVSHQGVLARHRNKVVKLKAFAWYKEAKRGLTEMIDDSKLMLQKIRKAKLTFKSLGFQYVFTSILVVGVVVFLLFFPQSEAYRLGTLSWLPRTIYTGIVYGIAVCYGFLSIAHHHYKTYPFRMASSLRRNVAKQQKLSDTLDEISETFERQLVQATKMPRKITTSIHKVAVIGEQRRHNTSELIDYVYSEKEFYFERHRAFLVLHNIAFAGIVLASVAIVMAQILQLL